MKRLSLLIILPFCLGLRPISPDINLAINPSTSYILPGDGFNCLDFKSVEGGQAGELPEEMSVSGHRIYLPNFSLSWASDRELFISSIKIEIDHPSLEYGFSCTIRGAELEALLGRRHARIEPFGHVESDATNKPNPFKPCALTCGGIEIKTGAATFQTSANIYVSGYSVHTQTQEQRPEGAHSIVSLMYLE